MLWMSTVSLLSSPDPKSLVQKTPRPNPNQVLISFKTKLVSRGLRLKMKCCMRPTNHLPPWLLSMKDGSYKKNQSVRMWIYRGYLKHAFGLTLLTPGLVSIFKQKQMLFFSFLGTPAPSLTNTLMTNFSCGISQCQTTAVSIVMGWCTKQTLSLKLSSMRINVRLLRLLSAEYYQVPMPFSLKFSYFVVLLFSWNVCR